jgi:hypothetical protein
MIGDLLFASRSIDFRYNRAAGMINVANNGSTAIVNSLIADDNSPMPRDRVSFRYNHFDSAQSVTGFGPAIFDPATGVGTSFAQTKNYNLDRFTFSYEKTFLDQWMSVELRVPFSTTLSPNLGLSAGDVTGPPDANGVFPVTSTPQNTLGNQSTQLENLTLILKGLLYRSQTLNISGGLGIGIPTGADTSVRVTDYSGVPANGFATLQRVRDFHIDNETWSLSPFVAALYTPNDRFFAQGFFEVELPLNPSTINYTETTPLGGISQAQINLVQASFGGGPFLAPPFSIRTGISEQPLAHVDVGAGYWLVRDPSRSWVTGVAPTVELHYTGTLKSASVVTLPGDGLLQINPATGKNVPESPPQIGSQHNRLDFLDLTAATTFLIADRATVAVGAGVPLLNGYDRSFNWELHFQLNYYFGGPRSRFTPNF